MRRTGVAIAMLLASVIAGGCLHATEALLDRNGKPVRYAGRVQGGEVRIPKAYRPAARELRGAWVATVLNIDFAPQADAAGFMAAYNQVAANLAANRFNAIFFQIRPSNDAFYPSQLNPYSRYLAGAEGKGIPGFDPLKHMVAEAHRRGLEFHAWLNPYRVVSKTKLSKQAYLATLDPKNFARRHPEMVLETRNADGTRHLILDPGQPAVVKHVVDTVREIVENYAVDAIHFDDYFYPPGAAGAFDAASYRRYGGGRAIGDWRRSNVDTLVSSVAAAVRDHGRRSGRRVRFGISPVGIWANRKNHAAGSLTAGKESYFAQFADTRGWIKKGWIDYIVPQVYWPFGHEVAAYAALTDWWAAQVRGTRVALYIGMGAYQLGSSALWQDANELANQLRYNGKHPEIRGAVFFSYKSVVSPANPVMKTGMERVVKGWGEKPPFPRFQQ